MLRILAGSCQTHSVFACQFQLTLDFQIPIIKSNYHKVIAFNLRTYLEKSLRGIIQLMSSVWEVDRETF
jgi:hypothetical protein